MKQEGLLSLQVIFNLFRQHYSKAFFAKASDLGVGIIVRLPLASGLLSGKFSSQTQFRPSDHRNYNRNGEAFNVGETFAGLPFEKGIELTDHLKKSYAPKDMNMAQFALRWILDHEAVSCVIPGASKVQQVHSNAHASAIPPLTEDLHRKLNNFYTDDIDQFIRGAY